MKVKPYKSVGIYMLVLNAHFLLCSVKVGMEILLVWSHLVQHNICTAYQEALKKGEVLVAYGRVTFLGPAAAGKTSLKHGLMHKPLPPVPKSTIVAEVHTLRPVDSSRLASVSSSSISYWKEVTEEDEMEEIARLLAIVHDEHSKQRHSTIASESIPHNLQVIEREEDRLSGQQVKKIFEEAMRRAIQIKSDSCKIDHDVWLHVWDSGGQPLFLDLLPPSSPHAPCSCLCLMPPKHSATNGRYFSTYEERRSTLAVQK